MNWINELGPQPATVIVKCENDHYWAEPALRFVREFADGRIVDWYGGVSGGTLSRFPCPDCGADSVGWTPADKIQWNDPGS